MTAPVVSTSRITDADAMALRSVKLAIAIDSDVKNTVMHTPATRIAAEREQQIPEA